MYQHLLGCLTLVDMSITVRLSNMTLDDQPLLPLDGMESPDPGPLPESDLPDASDTLTLSRHSGSMENTAGQSKGQLAEIRRLAEERNKAWDDARAKSRELYEAIEASGISPTKIAANAPISRGAIYSLKNQMKK